MFPLFLQCDGALVVAAHRVVIDTLPVQLGLTRSSTFVISGTIPQAHLLLMSLTVDQNLVQANIVHLEDLKIQNNIRARRRVEQKNKRSQKTVHEYAWLELVETGNIKHTTYFGVGEIS